MDVVKEHINLVGGKEDAEDKLRWGQLTEEGNQKADFP